MINFDTSMTLDQLEGDEWGKPEFDSYLVTTCHRLRKKPVGEFTAEDFRIMIGQGIGLDFLVPLALRHLDAYPLAGGNMYEGALLKAVVSVAPTWWDSHSDLWLSLVMVLDRFEGIAELYQQEIAPAVRGLETRLFGIVEGKHGDVM